jgi:sortase (surface protein transpeptidase)
MISPAPATGAPEPSASPEPTRIPPTPAPPATRLEIPALGIDAPVVELPITDRSWDMSALTQEIAHLRGTGNPGEKNNVVLAGHFTLKGERGPSSAWRAWRRGIRPSYTRGTGPMSIVW